MAEEKGHWGWTENAWGGPGGAHYKPKDIFEGWKTSTAGHNEAMLWHEHKSAAVSTVEDGKGGKWSTLTFSAKPGDPRAPSAASKIQQAWRNSQARKNQKEQQAQQQPQQKQNVQHQPQQRQNVQHDQQQRV